MGDAIKTPNAPEPRGHYSQAVRIGSFLFVSGQLPNDQDGNAVRGALTQETSQALENTRPIVEAAEGTIEDMV
jgi:2-iminobutanoate/2-iminopropanoate deaminase